MSNPSINKRQKEKQRQDKQKEKQAKRLERLKSTQSRTGLPDGVDPDIAGIVPGPQPPADD